jgi:2-C-methyl-D-erythritol 4-phosphate cytidylyltransferase
MNEFLESVRANQQQLRANLRSRYPRSAQAAEWTMVHDGHRPTCPSDPRARDLGGGARSNHHQVICFHFEPPAAPKGKGEPYSN